MVHMPPRSSSHVGALVLGPRATTPYAEGTHGSCRETTPLTGAGSPANVKSSAFVQAASKNTCPSTEAGLASAGGARRGSRRATPPRASPARRVAPSRPRGCFPSGPHRRRAVAGGSPTHGVLDLAKKESWCQGAAPSNARRLGRASTTLDLGVADTLKESAGTCRPRPFSANRSKSPWETRASSERSSTSSGRWPPKASSGS